jgi:hypothetical protein
MANAINENAQLQRMKSLMTYGLNESKTPAYSSVEYSKKGANDVTFGIVREGTRYFIKQLKPNTDGKLVAENFEYIGGFRNRKDNMFESFASAQKFLGEKLIQINEEVGDKAKAVITEAWDIDGAQELVVEATRKMKEEIARQREIMANSKLISESGSCTGKNCKQEFEAVKGKDADKNSESPKADAKKGEEKIKDYNGKEIKGGVGAPFNLKPSMNESTTTPLSSRENPDYIDTSHGTKIGKVTGFGKPVEDKTPDSVAEENGGEAEKTTSPNEVNEEVALHNTDNQNSPAVGTEKVDGKNMAPFEEKATVTEAVDDLDSDVEDDADLEGGEDVDLDGAEDADLEGAEGLEANGTEELEPEGPVVDPAEEAGIEGDGTDVEARLSSLEAKIDSLLDAIDNLKYDDEPLYDDEEDAEGDEDFDAESDEDFEDDDEDFDEVVESKSYRKAMMNEENRLDIFGKHPAYQKRVMTYPQNTNPMKDGQYDMNDDSVESEAPYGQGLGSNAPFTIDPKGIDANAIVEEALRILKKKLQ